MIQSCKKIFERLTGMLSPDELTRYDRQILIDEIGESGQRKLKRSKVMIAGAGGLGSTIALYLAAAGIGTIRIVDHDRVELSNLNRQILHWHDDIGRNKISSAGDKLKRINPLTEVEPVCEALTPNNISQLAAGSDIIVDALDNLETRLLLNRAAFDHNIPLVHGAVKGFEGRILTVIPGRTACLRCIYKGPLEAGKFPVIGVTPAVVGSLQATEVIKYLVRTGDLLTNRLLIYDGLSMTFDEFKINKNPDCEQCGKKKDEG
ncbi:ThiF family adenylyltransferase [Thermodesulfobacteriota bacterium]